MKVGVCGSTGRMGRLLIEEVAAAGFDFAGGIGSSGDFSALAEASDVVIEFSRADCAAAHASIMARLGKPWVLGTSGLSAADEAAVTEAGRAIPVVYAANFAPGAVVALAIAERLAAALPAETFDAEIVEMHHRQKVDAPSGTAVAFGRAVAAGRGVELSAVTEAGRDGHVGPRATGAIGFSSMRGGQVVGEHTVLFAGAAEHVSITHRAFDRRAFATGAVQAAGWVTTREAGVYGMRDVLGI